MKVQCDVCSAEAASVFCCADEAALCDACDRSVHRANKLAGKHRRFSLLHPCSSSSSSSSSSAAQKPPLCDICQERRGFFFCKEDRAILCRECDAPVHSASDMTRRHSRFLLTGVRLSSAPVDSAAGPFEEEEEEEDEEVVEQENSRGPCNDDSCSGGAGATTAATASDGSSISEYLTKTLPGWHVEDFLIDDASAGGDVVGVCADGLGLGLLSGTTWTDQWDAARSLHAVDGEGAGARRRRRRAGQLGAVGAADARGVRRRRQATQSVAVASLSVLVIGETKARRLQ